LTLTKHEPAADPLELLFDVQLGGVEVHVIPGQAEDFAFAQAENKDQDEGGVQGFGLMPGRFEEPAGIINGPGLPFTAGLRCPAPGPLHCLDRVTADHFIIDRARRRGPERVTGVFAAPRGQSFLAAFPESAAASFMLRPRLVLSLCTALAYGSELVEPLPDIFHLYIVDPLTAEMRIMCRRLNISYFS
jgi:hypothetical protein